MIDIVAELRGYLHDLIGPEPPVPTRVLRGALGDIERLRALVGPTTLPPLPFGAPAGCVCPPGAEAGCRGPFCPRQPMSITAA